MKNNNHFISGTVVTKESIVFSKDYIDAAIADLFSGQKISRPGAGNMHRNKNPHVTGLKTFCRLPADTEDCSKLFQAVKNAGYNGVETATGALKDGNTFRKLLQLYHFPLIAQVHTYGETVNEHVESFCHSIQQALAFNPIMINSHSGKDSWGADEKNSFFMMALAYEEAIGIPVAHQIQRGRITYNPWDTRDFLLNFEALKLCCDFSQWVGVCGRLLNAEEDIIRLCAERCIHLHSRIGYEQGCQVPDPRMPEYAVHIKAHEDWWDIIWQEQKKNGVDLSTLTPVFDASVNTGNTSQCNRPSENAWEICKWMKDRQKKRFGQL